MDRPVRIGSLSVGGMNRPVFTAEIGINHDGDWYTARDLAKNCIYAGADIIKFQKHYPAYEMLASHDWYDLMTTCSIDLHQLKAIVEGYDREFLCTPFCREAADDLEEMGVCAFKIGSGEANNIPFLKHVALKGKPMIISTGMTIREELIRSYDAVMKINRNIIFMNCTSNYPSTPRQTRLARIDWLKRTFGIPIGQSDHSPSISTALGAIARGACMIEKHVTLDKNADGPDHKVSLLPSEFKQMVDMGMEIWEGMQDGTEANMCTLVEGEQELRDIANHSVVTIKPIKRGDQFTMDNVWVKRPGTGIPAADFEQILNGCAASDLEEGHQLCYNDMF